MSNPFLDGAFGKKGNSNPFLSAALPRTGSDDLAGRIAELESVQQQTGAPGIEEDKPGVFRRILDLLSRPNYAIAGFVEEVGGEEPSVTRGVKRALTEIFSGVGGIQGEKRAFGEVLENLGVGTTTLADAFPALEGTWVGNFGSRGAAGLALDIFTDPLTYMTFGAGTGLRIATSKGVRYLNRAGADEFTKLVNRNIDEFRKLPEFKAADDVGRTRLADRAVSEAEKQFEAAFMQGGKVVSDLAEPGGAKLFGATIPGSDQLGKPMRAALSMLPESVAKPAVEGASQMRDGMLRVIRGIFSPEGALANLPEPIRTRAVRLTNSFFRSSTAHRARLMNEMEPLARAYRKLEKSDPAIGKRWYDVREGVEPRSIITNPDELVLFDETMALYESMGQTLLEHGVLRNEQILPRYIYHTYKNAEDLSQYHPRPGVSQPGTKARFEKERIFETYHMAEEESRRLHELSLSLLSRKEADRLYPILEPEYDVFKNMKAYIGAHADVLARKAWREEMAEQFGKTIDEFDFDAVYEARGLKPKKTPGSPEDFTPDKVPLVRSIADGEINEAARQVFGADGAQYVAVKSKLTNNELVYLPKAIIDELEQISAPLFNTKDYPAFGKLLKGFDWLNNNFKWGVYTLWPASATRDAYSNVALAMLRTGVSALNPARHIDAVRLMAGKELGRQFANSGYTLGQLRDLSKTFGVWVPGQVFVEQTGRFKLGRFRRALTQKRAGIENEARILLWLDEIRRGVDPRSAADTVGQFLFNYGELSRVERDLFRRLIPFYTFTRKNVELQWKMLRRNPGIVANQLKPFRGRTEENEQMVQWEAEALKLRMDKDGKTVHMLTGIDLPLRNVDALWRGDLGRTGRSIVGMITPVIKTIPEVLLNQDFFLGRDLTRTQSSAIGAMLDKLPTPKPVKDWLGYKKEVNEAGKPRYTFDGRRFTLLFRSWMLSRAISTSDRQFRDNITNGGVEWQRMMLDVLTGIRRKDIDLTEQMDRKMKNRVRQLEESLARRGVMSTFSKRYTPKEQGELE